MIVPVEQVISLQNDLIIRFGEKKGILDHGLLELSVNSIYQTFDGKELYLGNVTKAARLSYSLNCNHAFNDGNKRIAMHMLALMLRYDGFNYKPTNQEVIRAGLAVAGGQMNWMDFLKWVEDQGYNLKNERMKEDINTVPKIGTVFLFASEYFD